jgi:hypothetical protein
MAFGDFRANYRRCGSVLSVNVPHAAGGMMLLFSKIIQWRDSVVLVGA